MRALLVPRFTEMIPGDTARCRMPFYTRTRIVHVGLGYYYRKRVLVWGAADRVLNDSCPAASISNTRLVRA
jgi:hypothetical protein